MPRWTDEELDELAASVRRMQRRMRRIELALDDATTNSGTGWAKIIAAIATLMMGLGALVGPIIIAVTA